MEMQGIDQVEVYFEDKTEDQFLSQALINLIKIASSREGYNIGHVTIILTNDLFLQEYNLRYRKIDKPTDVLSFDLRDTSDGEIEGDIYISLDRAEVQSQERNDPVAKEVARLAVHGFLHLCGWEHPDDVSLREMIERGEKLVEEMLLRKDLGN